MTQEKSLYPERYGEIADMMYRDHPSIEKILPRIMEHVQRDHFPDSETIPDLKRLFSEIEHLDAVLNGRRTLEELTSSTSQP